VSFSYRVLEEKIQDKGKHTAKSIFNHIS